MKNRNLFIVMIICFTISVQNFKINAANFSTINYTSDNAVNFVENGITFSVFQNGEFDFFLNAYTSGLSLNYNNRNVGISFNAGYNYDAYVQYDQYGAVIQIENTPVFYDRYGRISRVGNININYYSGRLVRVGTLQLHYNSFGHFAYHTGFINHYNRHYVYHPHHNWFIRPYATYSIVRPVPYRHHYSPHRHHYYNDHRYGYTPKKHHKGHHVDKRNRYAKHYNKGKSHKKNYVSHDYRRKEYTTHRSPSSSNKMYVSGRKSKNGLHNKTRVSNSKTTHSNGYNPRATTTVQRAPSKRSTQVKRYPSIQSLSKSRQSSKSFVTNKNENHSTRQAVSRSSPKRSVSSSTTKRTTGKQGVHRRPKNAHLTNVKQRKTIKTASKTRSAKP